MTTATQHSSSKFNRFAREIKVLFTTFDAAFEVHVIDGFA